MASNTEKKTDDIKFEDAMNKLEALADMLQNENVPLDEASAAYEEAIKYYAICKRILEDSSQKIVLIDENGEKER